MVNRAGDVDDGPIVRNRDVLEPTANVIRHLLAGLFQVDLATGRRVGAQAARDLFDFLG